MMKTTQLYFVRHGETLWNAEKRMQGHLNSDLTMTGKKQAQLLGETFAKKKIDHCYTSDSLRAIETTKLVIDQLPVIANVDSRLREISMGTWEGRTRESIHATDPSEWQQFWQIPHLFQGTNGGETFSALNNRSQACLKEILTQHRGERILIVSHRLTIKTMINTLLGQELGQLNQLADVEPNSLSILEWSDNKANVLVYSDTTHYQEQA